MLIVHETFYQHLKYGDIHVDMIFHETLYRHLKYGDKVDIFSIFFEILKLFFRKKAYTPQDQKCISISLDQI
jgi:hypothetical protein